MSEITMFERLCRTLCRRHQSEVRGLEGDELEKFTDENWFLYREDILNLLRELQTPTPPMMAAMSADPEMSMQQRFIAAIEAAG